MQKLVWQNANGDEINLTGGNYGITEWEGFSNASLNIQNQQVPFQDGAVFLDALIEPRELSVTLKMQDKGNLEARYEMRRELIHALNPKIGEGYLIYTNDFISKRIKCIPQIPLFETHNSDTRGTPKASLAWTACEPYWEDLEETRVTLLAGVSATINNEGDIPTQVEIKLQNTNNVLVQNITNKKILKIVDLPSQKNITINTNNGQKTVEENLTEFKSVYGSSLGLCEGNNGEIVQGIGSAIRVTEKLLYSKEYSTQYYVGQMAFFNGYYYFNDFNFRNFYKTQDFKTYELAITVNTDYPNFFGVVNNKLFISGSGKLYYTEDGTNWTEKTIADFYYIYGMTYWNGTYYICDLHHIYSTTDLQNWTLKYTPQNNNNIWKIEHNNSILVVVGDGIIITSSDGSQWNENTVIQVLRGIIVKDNIFYTVGQNGAFLKSIDGLEWVDLTSSVYSDITFTQIINSSLWGLIINGGSGFIITFDGNVLSEHNMLGNCPTSNIDKILKYKDGLCAKGSFSDEYYVHILINGRWRAYSFDPEPRTTYVLDIFVTQDNNIIASASYRSSYSTDVLGTYISEDDGVTFTRVLDKTLTNIIKGKNDCIYGLYYDMDSSSYKVYISSDNGHNWTMEGTLSLSITQNVIYSDYYDKYFVLQFVDITSEETTYILYSSDDGLNFTSLKTLIFHQSSTGYNTQKLHCFDNEIIIMGITEVYQSFNGVNFVKQEIQWTEEIRDIDKQGKVYIAIDMNNNVLRFTDFTQIYSMLSIRGALCVFIDRNNIYIGCQVGYIGLLVESTEKENLIANLSADSDMTFNLELGNNIIISNALGDLIYRQKYIGV